MISKVQIPSDGAKITADAQGKLTVPNNPIVPYIEGDGIGKDVTPAMLKVVNSAVKKAYNGEREIKWMEIFAGEKSTKVYGENVWLPEETYDFIKDYCVAIKGPLTTPVGGGIRSLNVSLRQTLDLYICLRPVRYFQGVPSPVKHPEYTDMVIFRENAEDIYAGIEWEADSEGAKKVIDFLRNEMKVTKIRFPETCGIGVKPMSKAGTERLIGAAIDYAIANDRASVTIVHKGNIMKFTEGGFKKWGYEVAEKEFKEYFEEINKKYEEVIVVASSIGAYFTMCSLNEHIISRAYFISPIVDMKKLIEDMMIWANVSLEELKEQKRIETSFGETLDYEYYTYVKNNPLIWNKETYVLYGDKDSLITTETIDSFVKETDSHLTVMKNGEHWFHTAEQMNFLDEWIKSTL